MKHSDFALSRPATLPIARRMLVSAAVATATMLCGLPAQAQHGIHSPVSASQRGTAQRVAHAGVPISELAPNAPDEYTVRRGDTLWGISGKFLKSPWRWPELWGMNMRKIRNPHLIYPGQQLYLERVGGRAILRVRGNADGSGRTVRVTPQTRVEALDTNPLSTLRNDLIEPFLAEPIVVNHESTYYDAPRVVALADHDRVLVSSGERAYARGPAWQPLQLDDGVGNSFRVFRTATPLIDPVDGAVLGYEGVYVGQAELVRGESESDDVVDAGLMHPPYVPLSGETQEVPVELQNAEPRYLPVPATIDIITSKEEIRAGDRLLAEPEREFRNYVPHAPQEALEARVVSVYGSAVRFVGNNQIVAINKGSADGVDTGTVLSLLTTGPRAIDRTNRRREAMRLPNEANGLGMVFRVFDNVSYVLVMEVERPVQVGDTLINPG